MTPAPPGVRIPFRVRRGAPSRLAWSMAAVGADAALPTRMAAMAAKTPHMALRRPSGSYMPQITTKSAGSASRLPHVRRRYGGEHTDTQRAPGTWGAIAGRWRPVAVEKCNTPHNAKESPGLPPQNGRRPGGYVNIIVSWCCGRWCSDCGGGGVVWCGGRLWVRGGGGGGGGCAAAAAGVMVVVVMAAAAAVAAVVAVVGCGSGVVVAVVVVAAAVVGQ